MGEMSTRVKPESDAEVLQRAEDRLRQAHRVAASLDLVNRWSAVGDVRLVGAVAYDLVVSRDLDFEVFTDQQPTTRAGFRVVADLAESPAVTKVGFTNALDTPDQGLYWQVRCRDQDGVDWKIDVWTLARDHAGPCSAWLVEPLRRALTDELRAVVLRLKEARLAGHVPNVASIDLYRAVLEGGVRTSEELAAWAGDAYTPTLTGWRPRLPAR